MGFLDSFLGSFIGGASGGTGGEMDWGKTIGGGLRDVLPYAVQGGLQYYMGSQQLADKRAEKEMALAEAEKQRAFEKEMLMMKLAKGGGGGGGGSNVMAQLLQRALENQAATELTGSQAKVQSLNNMLTALQRGLGQVRYA